MSWWPTSRPAESKNLAVQRYRGDVSKDGEQPKALRNEENDGGAMQITGNELSLTVNEIRGSDVGERSSRRSADRASSHRSSETDYRAKYKELERRERESRNGYEQRLAEKDRRLQEMTSRQRVATQEEQRARETNKALNLEVLRLRSELHQMQVQSKRHSEESMVYKDEIRRAETQHETTKKILEEQTNELKGARAFLKHSNMLSGADVIAMVDRLNSEVYQGAASMVDTFEFEGQNRRMNDEAWKKATDDASKTIGGELMHALVAQRRKDQGDYNPTLIQFALQTCLIFCCWKTSISWALGDENSRFLKRIYDEIQREESQVVAGRWRSLTRAHIREARNPEAVMKQIVHELSAVLNVAGCSDEGLSTEFGEDLMEMATLAIRLQTAVGESITSMDLEPYILPPSIVFDPNLMEDDDGSQVQGGTIVGTTGLGLTQSLGGKDRTVLVKAKVLLHSALL